MSIFQHLYILFSSHCMLDILSIVDLLLITVMILVEFATLLINVLDREDVNLGAEPPFKTRDAS